MTILAASTKSQRRLALLLLLGVVTVWGSTFALVKAALADVSPLLFNLLRFGLATLLLLAGGWRHLRFDRPTLRGGLLAGMLLAAGYELQTAGLARTSSIHSAFLTGLVVIFVPLLSLIPQFRGPTQQRPGLPALAGAIVAFTGLVLLTTPAGTSLDTLAGTIGAGDLLTLGCAVAFAAHLLSLSRLAHLPATALVPVQICFCAMTMAVCLPLDKPLVLHMTGRLGFALALTSVLATAAAFFAQTWAQHHLSAATTALMLTLEPVIALLVSVLWLGERLSTRSFAGALLILLGIAITELLLPTKSAVFEPA